MGGREGRKVGGVEEGAEGGGGGEEDERGAEYHLYTASNPVSGVFLFDFIFIFFCRLACWPSPGTKIEVWLERMGGGKGLR